MQLDYVLSDLELIGPLFNAVTGYGKNYAGTQITEWNFQNKGTLTSPARLSFVVKLGSQNNLLRTM